MRLVLFVDSGIFGMASLAGFIREAMAARRICSVMVATRVDVIHGSARLREIVQSMAPANA